MKKWLLIFGSLLCLLFINSSFAMDNDNVDEEFFDCFDEKAVAQESEAAWQNFLNGVENHLNSIEQDIEVVGVKAAVLEYRLGLKTKEAIQELLKKFFEKKVGEAEKKKLPEKQEEYKDLGGIRPFFCSIQ